MGSNTLFFFKIQDLPYLLLRIYVINFYGNVNFCKQKKGGKENEVSDDFFDIGSRLDLQLCP